MWTIIEQMMKDQGMNQEQLAKRMRVHSGVISDFKLGHIKKPSFELMCKFADALDVSLDDLRN
ncbi:helix-turn-helix domain-containing protein [Latilactobacillus curvatus]|uniref:XRE family transcriptional regulator n=1 Tax=Latilactobacillus curvatus TaxID=28038 RepID=A0A385AFX9_LATCU|nr:helix-turn-helix transcriptional regulator [Latilactobacillus curvatus]WEU69654.1 HTH cro/C1-type domain-containing protein [Latilactobacillus phage TMW 1.1381 P1]AWV73290.1 XRE family transcriptional regulator [Latilactobacillus curvatus]AXN36216.1 XRE family transcriptional regulator [Latilactobacillus curvatus]MCT3525919.1 XRE family transcriptional regulator [Latilactobacillus curvatus]UTB70116.1 transcriptional regulator [Latilactobacillus curvatus]